MPQQIPFAPSIPLQRFATTLGEVQFVFDANWNARDEAWYFDLRTEDGEMIRAGVKIVLGTFLGRTADSRAPDGFLIASDLAGTGQDAGLDDLGTRVAVYFYSRDELEVSETPLLGGVPE